MNNETQTITKNENKDKLKKYNKIIKKIKSFFNFKKNEKKEEEENCKTEYQDVVKKIKNFLKKDEDNKKRNKLHLFGPYGSGKTTIINTIKKEYNKKKTEQKLIKKIIKAQEKNDTKSFDKNAEKLFKEFPEKYFSGKDRKDKDKAKEDLKKKIENNDFKIINKKIIHFDFIKLKDENYNITLISKDEKQYKKNKKEIKN